LKSSGDKASPVLDHSGWENLQYSYKCVQARKLTSGNQ
jgi:hypothetical protein